MSELAKSLAKVVAGIGGLVIAGAIATAARTSPDTTFVGGMVLTGATALVLAISADFIASGATPNVDGVPEFVDKVTHVVAGGGIAIIGLGFAILPWMESSTATSTALLVGVGIVAVAFGIVVAAEGFTESNEDNDDEPASEAGEGVAA